jgi:streptogramin lyase
MRLAAFAAALVLLAACGDKEPPPPRTELDLPDIEAVEGTKAFGDPAALAFAANGDLWVANYESSTLARYAPDQLAQSGAPTPATVVEAPSIKGPNAMVFDAHGYLWVAMYDAGSVAGFTPADLVAGRAPSIVMAPGGGVLVQPAGVALDADGNLWVSNSGVGHVVRFPRKGGLEAGTAKPDVVLDVPDEECQAVAVRDGKLWHGCADSDTVYVYDLPVRSGRPTARTTFRWGQNGGPACAPVQAAATPDGALAFACYATASVAVVTGTQPLTESARVSAQALTNVHGIAYDASGALWAGTNLNVLARYVGQQSMPDVVLRPRAGDVPPLASRPVPTM